MEDVDSEQQVLVLVSKLSGSRKQKAESDRCLSILKGMGKNPTAIDASDPNFVEHRDELLEISGVQGNYPQVFLRNGDFTDYLGGFDTIQGANDDGTLDLLLGSTTSPVPGNIEYSEEDTENTDDSGSEEDEDDESDVASGSEEDVPEDEEASGYATESEDSEEKPDEEVKEEKSGGFFSRFFGKKKAKEEEQKNEEDPAADNEAFAAPDKDADQARSPSPAEDKEDTPELEGGADEEEKSGGFFSRFRGKKKAKEEEQKDEEDPAADDEAFTAPDKDADQARSPSPAEDKEDTPDLEGGAEEEEKSGGFFARFRGKKKEKEEEQKDEEDLPPAPDTEVFAAFDKDQEARSPSPAPDMEETPDLEGGTEEGKTMSRASPSSTSKTQSLIKFFIAGTVVFVLVDVALVVLLLL